MDLTLNNLSASKAFSALPVKKELTWNGNTFTTYVRSLSYQTAMGQLAAINGADPVASRIAASICDAHGKPVFTVADITGEVVLPEGWKEGDPLPEGRGPLDPDLAVLLLATISEVQKLGKAQASTLPTNSGVNLYSTESAAPASRKRKPR